MKGSLRNYHLKDGVYEDDRRGRLRPRRCVAGIRDRRPVPVLMYAIDKELQQQEREARKWIAEQEELLRNEALQRRRMTELELGYD